MCLFSFFFSLFFFFVSSFIQSANGVKKIKTLGDCYVASAGILEVTSDHASNLISFGLEMHDRMVVLQQIPDLEETFANLRVQTSQDNRLRIRVGINSGAVVGGVVGDPIVFLRQNNVRQKLTFVLRRVVTDIRL